MLAKPCHDTAGHKLTGDKLKACEINNPCHDKITWDMLRMNYNGAGNVVMKGNLQTQNPVESNSESSFNHFPMDKNPDCFVPVDDGITCLWYQATANVWFDLMDYFIQSKELSYCFNVLSLFTLVLYFVTSSDSGSLIVDIIASNGDEEPPMLQRIFWALTEGACAIALLYSGVNVIGQSVAGEGGLRALQAASIVMGLPYTFVLFWFSQALVQVAREEAGELDPERPRMKKSIFDLPRDPIMFLRATFAPGFSPAVKQAAKTWPCGGPAWQIVMQVLYVLVIVFMFIALIRYSDTGPRSVNWLYIAGACYIGFAGWLSLIRRAIRVEWNIQRGDFFTDFFCAISMPMFTLVQLEVQMNEPYAIWPPVKVVEEVYDAPSTQL
jgi:hypothetical protein